jgi:hypothetical protein
LLASRPPRKPAKYTGLRVPGHDGFDRSLVQPILADDLALELDDRDPSAIMLPPVVTGIDVTDLDFQAAAYERQQRLDEDVAEMAIAAAINVERGGHGLRHPARRNETPSA